MTVQQYKNKDGVVISAELVEDEESPYNGLYRAVDKDNNVGHISEEQLKSNFVVAPPAPTSASTKG